MLPVKLESSRFKRLNMGSFVVAFNAVMPVVLLVAFGYFLKQQRYFNKTTIAQLNKLCFDLLLPIVTFDNIRRTNLNEVFDLRFVLYAAGSIFIAIFLLVILVPLFETDRKKQGVIIQGTFRSNFVMLGIPLIFITSAVYLGFSSNEIVALVALYGSPTAVISAVMAEQLGCDHELAAQVVIFSTIVLRYSVLFLY